jgi:Ca-activated chloride channel family protein
VKVLAALAFVLAVAPAARAATPVTGSGSLNDAPVIAPGEYSDTILPGEQLYYGVRVEAGQRIALQARSSMPGERFRDLVSLLRFKAFGPLREPVSFEAEGDVRDTGNTAGFEAGPAEEGSSDPYLGPGTWYVGVHAFWGGRQAPPKAEIPFTFALEVAGAAGSTPTPTPTATPTPTPQATPAPPRPAEEKVDPAAIGAVGMSGLLLGLLGGSLAGRRRR